MTIFKTSQHSTPRTFLSGPLLLQYLQVMTKYIVAAIVLFSSFLPHLSAEESRDTSPSPLVGFWDNTIESHTGVNSLWHIGSLAATGIMFMTPVDQKVMEADKNYFGDTVNIGALIVGTWWHVLPAAIVYWTTDNTEHKYASSAVVQAVGISFLVTTTEKFIFGRPFIDKGDDRKPGFLPVRTSRDARDFYPFQSPSGLWPSGHTATAFAAASALAAFYQDDDSFIPIAILAYSASALMGYAMIDGNIHWASDVVAGVLIGHAIGWTVGSDFKNRYDGTQKAARLTQPSFIPLIAHKTYGVMVTIGY